LVIESGFYGSISQSVKSRIAQLRTQLVGMRNHVTEDFVNRMSVLFRVLRNPRPIVFDSNKRTHPVVLVYTYKVAEI